MPWPGTPALPHLRVSWGGTLGTPATEIWSNSLAWQINDGTAASEAELQAIAQATSEYWSELITFAQNQVSPAVKHTWTKAVWVLNTGKQRDQNTAIYDVPAGGAQGGGSAVIWEQSYAATFRTALKRGRGHSGRIYLPVCGPMPEGTTPYAPAAFANNLATNVAGAINAARIAIDNALDGVGRVVRPVVVSRGTEQNPTPALTIITGVVVDRVADIQHRRVNRVPRLEGNLAVVP